MLSLEKELSRIINNTKGEGDVSLFLAKNPKIVYRAFYLPAGHAIYVLKKFPLGSHYKTDFVVPMASSGMWEVQMIELEPLNDKVINADGTPSHRLKGAISQIGDWKSYIDENRNSVREDLSEWCMKKDLLGIHGNQRIPCNYTGNELRSPATHIRFYYHVIIGRREQVTEEQRRKMNQLSRDNDNLTIRTYGSLLDAAKKIDELR